MVNCEKCEKPVRIEEYDTHDHYFSGYGFSVQYHEECCPIVLDEMTCEAAHPSQSNRPGHKEKLGIASE